MLKIHIEGDEAHVYNLLAALGSHAYAVVTGSQASAPQPPQPDPVEDPSPKLRQRLVGRTIAEAVVSQWKEGWDLPPDEQPDRSHILASMSPFDLGDLQTYLTATRDPWVTAGATPPQASHIKQVGTAMQLLPS